MEEKWKIPQFFFGEADFEEKMNLVGAAFREAHYREGDFAGADGARIHYTYVLHPQEKASIVISHGFCEFIRKYDELIYYLYQLGYSVFFVDHRGHGFSKREVEDLDKVYIHDFSEYVEDLKAYMEQVVEIQSRSKKYILFGHSMGGAIAALFLETYPECFEAAVLSSPMIKMKYGKFPRLMVKFLAWWSVFAGWQERYIPGHCGFDNRYAFEESCGQSRGRYDYVFHERQQVPQYRTSGSTYGWTNAALKVSKPILKHADRVQIPVLLLQAGCDTLVQPKAQELFAKRSGNTRIVRFPESKHEIFNAEDTVREAYFDTVFTFMEEQWRCQ